MKTFKSEKLQPQLINMSLPELINEFYSVIIPSSTSISIFGNGIYNDVLEDAAKGLIYLRNNRIRIRLMLAYDTSPSGLYASEWNKKTKEKLIKEIRDKLLNPISIRQKKYIEILGCFLNRGDLAIKYLPYLKIENKAIQSFFNSSNVIKIFCDQENQIICTQKHISNPNIINLFWSWGDPENRALKAQNIFDGLFNQNLADEDFSNQLKELILAYSPDSLPDSDPGLDEDISMIKTEIELWPHQKDALDAWFENNYRGIFKMCTGAGKTITAIFCIKTLAQKLRAKGHNLGGIVIACPTKVLVEQWLRELDKFGFEKILDAFQSVHNFISKLSIFLDSSKRSGECWVVVTTYKTFFDSPFGAKIKLAMKESEPGMLISDEMHNLASVSCRKKLKIYGDYFNYRIGLSATPEIEGYKSATNDLKRYFGDIVSDYDLARAIKDGVLCSYNYYPQPKLIEETLSDDYLKIIDLLEEESNIDLYRQKRALILKSKAFLNCLDGLIPKLKNENGGLKRTLVFGPPGFEREQAEFFNYGSRLLAQAKKILESHDILCNAITANTPNHERPKILKDFENEIFDVLLSIGCLDEGMDIPCIKRAIMLYSVDREKQFIQRRGRVLRNYHDKPYAEIYDLILLPHITGWPQARMEKLIQKEMRRYKSFAKMARNKDEAHELLRKGIQMVLGGI